MFCGLVIAGCIVLVALVLFLPINVAAILKCTSIYMQLYCSVFVVTAAVLEGQFVLFSFLVVALGSIWLRGEPYLRFYQPYRNANISDIDLRLPVILYLA